MYPLWKTLRFPSAVRRQAGTGPLVPGESGARVVRDDDRRQHSVIAAKQSKATQSCSIRPDGLVGPWRRPIGCLPIAVGLAPLFPFGRRASRQVLAMHGVLVFHRLGMEVSVRYGRPDATDEQVDPRGSPDADVGGCGRLCAPDTWLPCHLANCEPLPPAQTDGCVWLRSLRRRSRPTRTTS